MPKTTVTSDLFCNGALKTTGDWGGVSLSYLLTQAQISPDVLSLDFDATDNYCVSIPVSLAMQPQIIIAYDKNNEPLIEGLRLILPGINGPLWIASISSIGMNTVQVADQPFTSTATGTVGIIPPMPYSRDAPQESTNQQPAIQPTPANPQNQPSPTSTTPPADTSVLHQANSAVQPSSSLTGLFTIALPTAVALFFALLATVYITVRRRRSASVARR
jgi:DMSO/TMAO reductase YedYZ molybdopterin-dependent catalytic subunit